MAWYILATVLGLIALRLTVVAISPSGLKLRPTDGRLAPCPNLPNCVSSQADRASQKIEPIAYAGSPEDAKLRLRLIVDGMPDTKVLRDDRVYMHVEFRSFIFGFVDDVEFLIDDARKLVHVRAASRLAYRLDFGVNRRRVERIRRLFKLMAK